MYYMNEVTDAEYVATKTGGVATNMAALVRPAQMLELVHPTNPKHGALSIKSDGPVITILFKTLAETESVPKADRYAFQLSSTNAAQKTVARLKGAQRIQNSSLRAKQIASIMREMNPL